MKTAMMLGLLAGCTTTHSTGTTLDGLTLIPASRPIPERYTTAEWQGRLVCETPAEPVHVPAVLHELQGAHDGLIEVVVERRIEYGWDITPVRDQRTGEVKDVPTPPAKTGRTCWYVSAVPVDW